MYLSSPGLSPIVNLSPIIDKSMNRDDDDDDDYSNNDFDDDENDESHKYDIHNEQSIIINQMEQSNKNDPINISNSSSSSAASIFIHQNNISLLSTSSYLNTKTTYIKENDDSLRYISHLNMSDTHFNDNYNDTNNDNNKNHIDDNNNYNDVNNNDNSSLMMMSYLPDMTINSDYDHVNINTINATSVPSNDHINHNSNAGDTETRINAIPLQFGITYSLNLDDNGLVLLQQLFLLLLLLQLQLLLLRLYFYYCINNYIYHYFY